MNKVMPSKPAAAPPQVNLLAMTNLASDSPAQHTVANALENYVTTSGQSYAGMLLCGDNFSTQLTGSDDPRWQRSFEKAYDPTVLNFPFYVGLGNQDYASGNSKTERKYARENPQSRWKYPAPYYRIDIPDNLPMVTVLMLDSNQQAMTQAEWNAETYWLKSELQRPRTSRWVVVASHHPLFRNVNPSTSLEATWGALIKQYGVDLYLCGHNRDLEHLEEPGWPMSFVYLGGEDDEHQMSSGFKPSGPARETHGFASISFTPYAIDVKLVDSTGQVMSEFRRSKAGTVESVPTEMPTAIMPSNTDDTHGTTRPATWPTARTIAPTTGRSTFPTTHFSTTRPTH